MTTTKFQVRWDWYTSNEPEEVHQAESQWFTAVVVTDALSAARRFLQAMDLRSDGLADVGVNINNLRIVKVTEEVIR